MLRIFILYMIFFIMRRITSNMNGVWRTFQPIYNSVKGPLKQLVNHCCMALSSSNVTTTIDVYHRVANEIVSHDCWIYPFVNTGQLTN